MAEDAQISSKFIAFRDLPAEVQIPECFTFPFYYSPHPLSLQASKELQHYLETQTDWQHDFGLENPEQLGAMGKMFGVLVVQNSAGELGYLAGFSGKLAKQYHLSRFVPPVYDLYQNAGFYAAGEKEINGIGEAIEAIENDPAYHQALADLANKKTTAADTLSSLKKEMKSAKASRKIKRLAAIETMSDADYKKLDISLSEESIAWRFKERDLKREWTARLAEAQAAADHFTNRLNAFKEERKQKSNALQARIFEQYQFLNKAGVTESLNSIFAKTVLEIPPAGAGECAAPKLLQYAFLQQLTPVCMAEFWWGQSPKKIIRHHGVYYPACRGKCEPILTHMLSGMKLEPNPLLENPVEHELLDYIYEDDQILLVNKPTKLLSVPGREIQDCVWLRVKWKLPEATGPLIVHRLDMPTSGLLLVAKTKEAHKFLQAQFIQRTVKKRYEAVLEGRLTEDAGQIKLPLTLDYLERPRQMVDYDHGKPAHTDWEVIERTAEHTRVYFYPRTGRTHQLRVHAAHKLGLDAPIVGDHLYGKQADRLHLHAGFIEFIHPESKEVVSFEVAADF